jgi:hypothetical protein
VIKVNVRFDKAAFERDLNKLRKNVIPKVMARAINRAADGVKAEAVRSIARLTKLKQREVRSRIYVRGATPKRLIAEVEAFPYSPNLKEFRATQNKTGTAASAWEKRKTYRHAFIHPKTQRVVTRTTTKRYPLKGLKGPSVPKTFMQQMVLARLVAVARQRWRSEMERELARRLAMNV